MIILCQIFLYAGIAKRVMMQDGHCHEDHMGDLGWGDTPGAFALGNY